MEGFEHSVASDLGPREGMQVAAGAHHHERSKAESIRGTPVTAPADRPSETGEAIAEVKLVMHYQQLEGLEKAASSRGMTMAHLLRRLIRNGVAALDGPRALEEPAFIDTEAEGGMDHR